MHSISPNIPLFGPLPFYKKCLAIALPVMAQQLIQQLVTLIDNFMVSGLGDIKMSGVNVAGQINFVFLVLMNTIYLSGGIFMSQYNGAKNPGGMRQVFRFKLILGLFCAITFTVLCLMVPRSMLGIMLHGNSARDAILDQGELYMQVLAFSWIPAVISGCISTSLREIGRVKPPLLISVCATLLNTFFNWMFIYGNLGAPRLEVRGAAIATIIARLAEVAAFLYFFYGKKPPFFSHIREIFKIKPVLFMLIFSKSLWILATEMTWAVSETVTTALYNSRGGAEIVSGMAAGFNIANLLFIAIGGVFTSTGVVLGGTLGAGKLDEARKQARWLMSGSIIFGLFAAGAGSSTLLLIPVVYANLSTVAQFTARNLVLVVACYMPLWTFINAQFAVARTGGDTVMGVVMDVTVNTLLFVPGMVLLTRLTSWDPVKMYALVKLTDFVKIGGAFLWLKKERWLKNLVAHQTE